MQQRYFFIFACFAFFQFGFGQEKTVPLRTILSAIENQHHVSFNFLDEDVAEYRIVPPEKEASLTTKMAILQTETKLDFHFIDQKSIGISKRIVSENPINNTPLEAEKLQEIVIEKYLTTGISKKTDGSFRIRPKQFGILPGLTTPDVLQTMQQLPGIMSPDETISNISIRGGTHDQNLFLWNGIRMFQTGHFFGLISAFNPLLAQEITIYKNGSSAFYGENVSGIVAISSENTTDKKSTIIQADLLSVGFYKKLRCSKNATITLSGRRSLTDFFNSPVYQKYSDRIFQNTIVTDFNGTKNTKYNSDKQFYFYDFTTQFEQKIGVKHALSVDLITISNSLEVLRSQKEPTEIQSRKSLLTQENFGVTANWKTKWNSKNKSDLSIYGSQYELNSKNASVETDQIQYQENKIIDTGIRLKNEHVLSDNFTLTNGYQYNETGILNADRINAPEFSRKTKAVLRTHALILETILHSETGNTFLKTGIRANYMEAFDVFLIEPRMQFLQKLTKNVQLEISGELKNQTASQVVDLQQDFLGIEKRRWILSDNKQTPIQKSKQIGVGFTFRKKNWLITLENYYKKVTGITTGSQAFQNQLEFLKMSGSYTVFGSEFLIQKQFGSFYAWLNYSLSHNEYTFKGYIPPHFDSNLDISQVLSTAISYDSKGLKLALGAKYFTGKPETSPTLNQPDFTIPSQPGIAYNNPNNRKLSDYCQVNFSASYQWMIGQKTNFQLQFSVLNLFNSTSVINRYYRLNSEHNLETVNTYALKITPNLSATVRF